MSLTLTQTLIPILRNISKLERKQINRELNIHLFDENLYSFEISTSVSKKSSYKIGALYTVKGVALRLVS